MTRRFLNALAHLLQRPLLGTRVVPRDSQLDLDLLPEDEFPIFCETCGYLLRGLPDGRCPECGNSFERSHLLLRQYVHEWFDVLLRTTLTGRVILWSTWAGLALVVLNLLGMLAVAFGGGLLFRFPASVGTSPNTPATLEKMRDGLFLAEKLIWAAEGLILLTILLGFTWAARRIRKRLHQCRRVLDAIVDPPGFRRDHAS